MKSATLRSGNSVSKNWLSVGAWQARSNFNVGVLFKISQRDCSTSPLRHSFSTVLRSASPRRIVEGSASVPSSPPLHSRHFERTEYVLGKTESYVGDAMSVPSGRQPNEPIFFRWSFPLSLTLSLSRGRVRRVVHPPFSIFFFFSFVDYCSLLCHTAPLLAARHGPCRRRIESVQSSYDASVLKCGVVVEGAFVVFSVMEGVAGGDWKIARIVIRNNRFICHLVFLVLLSIRLWKLTVATEIIRLNRSINSTNLNG